MTDPSDPKQSPTDDRKARWLGGCLLIFLLILVIGTCNRIVNGPPKEKPATARPEKTTSARDLKPNSEAPAATQRPKVVETEVESLPKCDSWLFKWEVVRLFKKAEVQLVKMYEPTEVLRSSTEVQCTGRAVWSDGRPDGIWYRMYVDEEGERLIEAREAALE